VINLRIDDKSVTASEGETVLDVADANGIFIPALCNHKAVTPYGSCRLCLVEVEKFGRKRVVASCSYLAAEAIRVNTRAPKALEARNIAMELLLARCPDNQAVRAMAARMGVYSSRFKKREHDCILCGLCVRVCKEVIGADCISFSGRGSERQVVTPYNKPSQQCMGCGACAVVCPTGAIRLKRDGAAVILTEWQTVLRQVKCRQCGQYFVSCRQLDHVQSKLNDESQLAYMCPDCRRKHFSRQALYATFRPR